MARARRDDGVRRHLGLHGDVREARPLGQAGAEQVTEVMNATFGALLDVAYALRWRLLKFGGDALLLFFDGDDHAARAARAAFEMRQTLRAIGRPKTSAGTVTLKMHVGIHSAPSSSCCAGIDHRELIVPGRVPRRQSRWRPRRGGRDRRQRGAGAALPAAVARRDRGTGVLLAAAPRTRHGERPLPTVDGLAARRLRPAPRPRAPHVGGRRAGAPAGGGRVHPPVRDGRAGRERRAQPRPPRGGRGGRCVQEAAAEHEVCFLESDIDRDGARIVLVAGAPRVSENDVERMLRTVRAAVEVETELPLSSASAGAVSSPARSARRSAGRTRSSAARPHSPRG